MSGMQVPKVGVPVRPAVAAAAVAAVAAAAGGGCDSGGCGSDKPMDPSVKAKSYTFKVGDAIVNVTDEGDSVFPRASLDNEARESNVLGPWVNYAGSTNGWNSSQIKEVDYSTNNITKFGLEITMSHPQATRYTFDVTGSWTNTSDQWVALKEQYRGAIPLRKVERKEWIDSDHYAYQKRRDFVYDAQGNLLTQRSYDLLDPEQVDGYIIYGYDPCQPSSIVRIWAGEDPCDYSLTGTPADGRWVDVAYDLETNRLTHLSQGCGSCGGGEQSYTYIPAQLSQRWINDDPCDPCYVPSAYLMTSLSDADGRCIIELSI